MGKKTYLYWSYVGKHPEDSWEPQGECQRKNSTAKNMTDDTFQLLDGQGHWFIPRAVSQWIEEKWSKVVSEYP